MKKTFLKKKPLSMDMSLQITSMADIFMILLVFLLKNYSATITSLTPSGDARLPVATAAGAIKDGLKIEISRDALLLDGKTLLKLTNFQFEGDEAPAISKALMKQRDKANKDSNLLLLADERTPYTTIQRVLASAAGTGFVDLQLVVVQAQ